MEGYEPFVKRDANQVDGYQAFRAANTENYYPIMIQTHCISNENTILKLLSHWHEEIEIWLILEGDAKVSYNGTQTIAKAGDVLLFNSYCVHSASPVTSHCRYHVILINRSMQRSDLLNGIVLPTFSINTDQTIRDIIVRIVNEEEQHLR